MGKKRYAVVGTGSRSSMYIRAITTTYKDVAELVGLIDGLLDLLFLLRMDPGIDRRLQPAVLQLLPLLVCQQAADIIHTLHTAAALPGSFGRSRLRAVRRAVG